MANPVTTYLRGLWPPRPWPVLLTGVAITLLGLLSVTLGEAFAGVRFVLFLVGLVTAGAAVSLRLRKGGQAFEERMESAGILAVAAFAALLAFLGTDPAWDSLQWLLVVLVAVALVGVLLVLLPRPARLVVAAVLILVHFGGMMTAATTISPPGSVAPWVSQELWTNFYRPYLQFMYLNNAYHFYSPEPGPPSLLWFHIRYENGQVKWFKIPHRDDDPVSIHHTRLLSITESTAGTRPPPQDFGVWSAMQQDRRTAGDTYTIPMDDQNYIMPVNLQYQEPQPYAQKMMESYVRHVAHTFPYLGDPGNPVKGIKVYRFRHRIIDPPPMAQGRDPNDPSMFVGYYQGEFDKDGNLLHNEDKIDPATGKQVDWRDRFRYWYIPIYWRPKDHSRPVTPDLTPDQMELIDCLTQHARLDLSVYPPVVHNKPGDPEDTPFPQLYQGAEKSKP